MQLALGQPDPAAVLRETLVRLDQEERALVARFTFTEEERAQLRALYQKAAELAPQECRYDTPPQVYTALTRIERARQEITHTAAMRSQNERDYNRTRS